MKDSYYFPHDYHARHDPKLEKVRIVMGCEGTGIYWNLIEMLYEQGGTLNMQDLPYFATLFNTDENKIKRLITSFDLFTIDGDVLSSESVIRRLEDICLKRSKARASADKRWGGNANAMRTQCERNAIKESKVKKEKESIEEPTTEIGGLILKNRFLEVIKKTYGGAFNVESEILACITWHKNKGREVKSWDRAITNWMKIAYENKGVVGGLAKPEGVKQWNKL